MSNWQADRRFEFTGPLSGGGQTSHTVHVKGSGPPIIILQELPGIGPETFALTDRLMAAGFSVWLPHLLGRFGKANTATSLVNTARLLCIRREFHLFLKGKQSPIAAWMRALCADVSHRNGGAQVGVIGMCLTGSFAIPLMAEDAVAGAVASQPSLPITGRNRLHMAEDEVAAACAAMATKGPALAMRYQGDKLCSPAHMAALKPAFGEHLEVMEIPGKGHSLLTLDFSAAAYARMEAYFRARFGLADQ